MGYDLCRFDDNSVDEELICCICREVLQDPVQVRCGGVWRRCGRGGVCSIDGRYALYAQLNGIALYAFLKLNLALLKSKPVIFRN